MVTNGWSSVPINRDLSVYCIQEITAGMMTSNTRRISDDFSNQAGGRILSSMKLMNSLRGEVFSILPIGRSMERQTCCYPEASSNKPNNKSWMSTAQSPRNFAQIHRNDAVTSGRGFAHQFAKNMKSPIQLIAVFLISAHFAESREVDEYARKAPAIIQPPTPTSKDAPR